MFCLSHVRSKMVRLEFCKPLILLATIHSYVIFTNGEQTKSIGSNVLNDLTSSSPFSVKDWNGAVQMEDQPKSRRKRYVAFPEGSSVSVSFSLWNDYSMRSEICFYFCLRLQLVKRSVWSETHNTQFWLGKILLYSFRGWMKSWVIFHFKVPELGFGLQSAQFFLGSEPEKWPS